MKIPSVQIRRIISKLSLGLTATALVLASSVALDAAQTPGVLPPSSQPYGKSYADWSVAAQQWGLGLPVEGHPYVDAPDFDVTAGQTGNVWFLAQPFGTVERTCTIPVGTALFLGLPGSEWSSLEGYATETEQRSAAEFFFEHITTVFCVIDGAAVKNLAAYGVLSPQFTFTAPSPWIFGDIGGTGTSVAKSYHIFVAPLSKGTHAIRFGGAFHLAVAEGDPFDFDASLDITYHLNVQ